MPHRLMLAACAALFALPAAADPFPDATRLVSIGGSLTEIVYALGEGERLVGRDSTAIYPPEALALPDLGYMRALSPEGVLSAGPTALLVLEGSGPPEALDVLEAAGVPYRVVPEDHSHEGILAKIAAVGDSLGVPDRAAALSAEIDDALDRAEALTRDVAEKRRVLFVLSVDGGKIQASGTGTAADAIIALAGGVNAVTEYEGYKALSEEAIIAARPDVILMMDRGGDHAATDADLLASPAIGLTPAGRDATIIRLDGAYLLGFGPRTADAVTDLARALYGAALAREGQGDGR
ncbi:heme/hemin ABC transporter substrate-binding protein [Arsenicitalea aurantiaca]|nr:ABC transporter substrate-binding protein [Arsenicitalea aurantiaca]